MKNRFGYAAQMRRAMEQARAEQLAQSPPAPSEPIAEPIAEPVAPPAAEPAATHGPYFNGPSAPVEQLQGQLNMFEGGYRHPNGFGAHLQGPSICVGGKSTDNETAVGATASLFSAGVSYQDDNQYTRIGLGAGPGAAVRGYHGDKEGFGFDFGPVSFDSWQRRDPDAARPPREDRTPYDQGW